MSRRVILLSVSTENEEQIRRIHAHLNTFSNEIVDHFPSVTVSAYEEGEIAKEQDEYFDEYTMFKVYNAMREGGITDLGARELINALQNAGILFRERVK